MFVSLDELTGILAKADVIVAELPSGAVLCTGWGRDDDHEPWYYVDIDGLDCIYIDESDKAAEIVPGGGLMLCSYPDVVLKPCAYIMR
jgi:hypothetical protein